MHPIPGFGFGSAFAPFGNIGNWLRLVADLHRQALQFKRLDDLGNRGVRPEIEAMPLLSIAVVSGQDREAFERGTPAAWDDADLFD